VSYAVKEIYYTIQGEGVHTGRPAIFCRFAGCNLWTGREEDRAQATCRFCDTDFVGTDGPGGGKFSSAAELAQAVRAKWPIQAPASSRAFVVCTGGEPLLQLDESLVQAFHSCDIEVAIETNGTRLPPASVNWICVSPKIGAALVLRAGNELKLVYPQVGGEPEQFEQLKFENFYLQPMDGREQEHNTQLAMRYCLEHPQWRLSLQTHKFLNIP
jgi:7-carboxy-7-deazaguanine synthase (Cx14CxxC type)